MKRVLIVVMIGLSWTGIAQQMPQFSQYLRNQFLVNPAAAGVYDFTDITVGGRLQWAGFKDAPMTTYAYGSVTYPKPPSVRYNPALRISNGPVRNPKVKTGKFKYAFGGMLLVDRYGAFQQFRGAVTGALHIPVSKDYNLSFGTNIGVSNRSFLKDRAQTLNMLDPSLGYTDNTYDQFAAQSNMISMDLRLGLYFYSKNLFVGIAADQVTRDMVSFGTNPANFDPNIHYTFTGGYKFEINKDVSLMPAVLLKYMTPAPTTLEGSLQVEYKEWIWLGASYRQGIGGFSNADAIVGMVGMNITRQLKFGYSFDYSLTKFNQHSFGGHEIVLGVMLR